MRAFLLSWGLVFLAAFFDSYAAFIVKLKFNEMGRMDYSSAGAVARYLYQFVQSPVLATAVVTFALAPALWFFALNRLELSTAYPVLVGLHLVFVLFFGVAFLGEAMTWSKHAGLACVAMSLFFFYRTG